MSGVLWALAAGVGFGFFQGVNRRANQLVDAYRGTMGLVLGAVIMLGCVSLLTQDLELLGDAPVRSFLWFAAAGVIHFFFGWTFLGLSQQQIGASRTGVILAITPLIASILAAVVLSESLPPTTLLGVLAAVVGVALIATRSGDGGERTAVVPWFALGAAGCWGTTPLFIRWGLDGLDAPLLGVTIGLAAALVLYLMALGLGLPDTGGTAPRKAVPWIALGAALVGGAIASMWIAFDQAEISLVSTLMQVTAPVVVFTAPIIVGTELERITRRLLGGTMAVVTGSMIVILTRGG